MKKEFITFRDCHGMDLRRISDSVVKNMTKESPSKGKKCEWSSGKTEKQQFLCGKNTGARRIRCRETRDSVTVS